MTHFLPAGFDTPRGRAPLPESHVPSAIPIKNHAISVIVVRRGGGVKLNTNTRIKTLYTNNGIAPEPLFPDKCKLIAVTW